jgi:hypothetical protein
MFADEEFHRHAVKNLARADALLFGRVTYEMMEAAWRAPARTGARPDWMPNWMEPFALTIRDLAHALADFLVDLHGETRAVVALLDARSEWSARRAEFRQAALQRIAQILMRQSPRLRPKAAEDIAVVLLHNMKIMKALTLKAGAATRPGAVAELREMNRLYLEHKLSKKQVDDGKSRHLR